MSFDAVFLKETEYIYRLKIPFETVYTSVFLIKSTSGVFLVDCATTEGDVDNVILPALSALGYKMGDIKPFDMFPRTQHVESVVLLHRE